MSVEILSTGRSSEDFTAATQYPSRLRTAWSAGRARECGPAGIRALASAMRKHSRSVDLKLLDEITGATQGVLDGGIYTAATGIADDAAATREARIFAFRTLIWLLQPGLHVTYTNLTDLSAHVPRCFTGGNARLEVQRGTPLPPTSKDASTLLPIE